MRTAREASGDLGTDILPAGATSDTSEEVAIELNLGGSLSLDVANGGKASGPGGGKLQEESVGSVGLEEGYEVGE